jgi:hypothetical protein
MVVSDYMEVLFVAQRQPVAQSVYHAISSALQAVVVIVASYFSHDVSTIIWSLAFFAVARFLFAIVYTHARYHLTLRHVSLASIRDQASFALPVGLAGIALLLISQSDKFIINRYMGREAFAIYTVGAFQVPFANIIRTSIGNVTLPLMAQYQKAAAHAEIVDLWRRSLLKTVVLFFPIFVFLEIMARPFIVILFTGVHDLPAAVSALIRGDRCGHPGVQTNDVSIRRLRGWPRGQHRARVVPIQGNGAVGCATGYGVYVDRCQSGECVVFREAHRYVYLHPAATRRTGRALSCRCGAWNCPVVAVHVAPGHKHFRAGSSCSHLCGNVRGDLCEVTPGHHR